MRSFSVKEILGSVAALVSLVALASFASCSSDRPSSNTARSSDSTARETETATARVSSAASGSPIGADGCRGREPHDCARTKGCLLDQPTYRAPFCRPAENPCEASVRHADLIGSDADPAVTPAVMAAAEKACLANPLCGVSSGRCSCPCAVLGACDCACGGSYFKRCTLKRELSRFDGRPPNDLGTGALGDFGRGLVAVAKAPSGRAFKVDPLPTPDSLVGKPRQDIENVLGTGTVCDDVTTAPCKSVGQVFYSLYRLDKGALGGGPELLLTYDASQKCSEAKLVFTR